MDYITDQGSSNALCLHRCLCQADAVSLRPMANANTGSQDRTRSGFSIIIPMRLTCRTGQLLDILFLAACTACMAASPLAASPDPVKPLIHLADFLMEEFGKSFGAFQGENLQDMGAKIFAAFFPFLCQGPHTFADSGDKQRQIIRPARLQRHYVVSQTKSRRIGLPAEDEPLKFRLPVC